MSPFASKPIWKHVIYTLFKPETFTGAAELKVLAHPRIWGCK